MEAVEGQLRGVGASAGVGLACGAQMQACGWMCLRWADVRGRKCDGPERDEIKLVAPSQKLTGGFK